MVNIEEFVKSLKPTWVKRILLENDSQWCQLFMTTLGSVKNLLLKGEMVYYYLEQNQKSVLACGVCKLAIIL